MCNGTIMDKLISFALPLMVSSILQLLFNAVDIIVVGRFTGSQALAAVGSTTALINMFVNLFIGVSLGANVLSARFYAAGKEREMSETVHTAMTFALISGIVMVFVGLFCTRGALELMDTPADVIDQAALYMKIYFCSMPFFMLYNYGAAVLRAVVFSHCVRNFIGKLRILFLQLFHFFNDWLKHAFLGFTYQKSAVIGCTAVFRNNGGSWIWGRFYVCQLQDSFSQFILDRRLDLADSLNGLTHFIYCIYALFRVC